jgi:hypothetical protein
MALVLIAGAAAVLWYGNTLNSWVLGGLIGGLAALLISIPISLTLFTYLSRQQEERLRAEKEEFAVLEAQRLAHEERLLRAYERGEARSMYAAQEEVSAYRAELNPPSDEDERWIEEQEHYLPLPPAVRPLSAPPASRRSAATQRLPLSSQVAATRKLPREPATSRHSAVTRRLGYPGFPGYQSQDTLSRLQSQALRQAREEAVRQNEGPLSATYRRNGRRIIDSSLLPISPASAEMENSEITGRKSHLPETEVLSTQPFTGDIQKPLVRRAPYMYDDDELKSEFAQQVAPPITRRSSRKLTMPQEDD